MAPPTRQRDSPSESGGGMKTPDEINAANAEFWKAENERFRRLVEKYPHDLSKAAELATKLVKKGMVNDPDLLAETSLNAAMREAEPHMKAREAGRKHLKHAHDAGQVKQAEAKQKARRFVAKVQEVMKNDPRLTHGKACDYQSRLEGIGKSTGRRYWDMIFPKSAD